MLDETDRGKPRILVNEALARLFFPPQDAVGKRLILGVMDPKQHADEIVGVVGDVRDLGLDQARFLLPRRLSVELPGSVELAGWRRRAPAQTRRQHYAAPEAT